MQKPEQLIKELCVLMQKAGIEKGDFGFPQFQTKYLQQPTADWPPPEGMSTTHLLNYSYEEAEGAFWKDNSMADVSGIARVDGA